MKDERDLNLIFILFKGKGPKALIEIINQSPFYLASLFLGDLSKFY
jgi:hypothetical protein